LGGWAGKSAMADATKTTARPIGHMTYTQARAVCEKNIFHLFHFTQPVKNHSSSSNMQLISPIYVQPIKEYKHIFHVFSRKQEYHVTYLCKKNKSIKLQTFA